jgi:hypothetical protein
MSKYVEFIFLGGTNVLDFTPQVQAVCNQFISSNQEVIAAYAAVLVVFVRSTVNKVQESVGATS